MLLIGHSKMAFTFLGSSSDALVETSKCRNIVVGIMEHFFQIYVEFLLLKNSYDLLQMGNMIFLSLAIDLNIIKVNT